MTAARTQPPPSKSEVDLADRLHSAAIHLLRRVRVQDSGSGLSAPSLSALSVIVFGGPIPMTELAQAEQVRLPTISRLVGKLEAEGLVKRFVDPGDRRVQLLEATPKGRRLLEQGRRRRVEMLAGDLRRLSDAERKLLERSLGILERLTLPAHHPRQAE